MISVKVKGDFIDGKFRRPRAAQRRIVSSDPGDAGWRIGSFPVYDGHVELAVAAAARAFAGWRRLAPEARADYLRKFAAEVHNRRRQAARLVAVETGKPLWEAEREVADVTAQVETEIREGVRAVSPFKVGEVRFGVSGRTRWRPLGPVAVLGPAVSPVHLACCQLLPALLCGCTVVYKPSKLTPACGQFLAEVFEEIDLPPGVFNLVQGDAENGEALARDEHLAGVSFIGSLAAGRRILEVTAGQPHKLVGLQMSGVNLAVVGEDADESRALVECLKGAYLTTGQQYTATSVVLVQRRRLGKFAEALAHAAGQIRIGHAFDKDVFMGPLLSAQARERFLEAQARLQALPLRALLRGQQLRTGRPGHYVTPAVWVADEALAPDTIWPEGSNFGPDLVVVPYANIKEAKALAAANRLPLALAYFGPDEQAFRDWVEDSPYGLCNFNLATTELSLRLPLSAPGACGNHRPAGVFAQRNFCEPVASLETTAGYRTDNLPPGLPRVGSGSEAAG